MGRPDLYIGIEMPERTELWPGATVRGFARLSKGYGVEFHAMPLLKPTYRIIADRKDSALPSPVPIAFPSKLMRLMPSTSK